MSKELKLEDPVVKQLDLEFLNGIRYLAVLSGDINLVEYCTNAIKQLATHPPEEPTRKPDDDPQPVS